MLLLATLASCGGGDAASPPTEPTGVSVTLSVGTVGSPTIDGSVSCIVGINAAVSGNGQGTWVGATYRMLDAATKSRVFASGEVTGAILLDGFGTGSLIAGKTERSSWRFAGPAAFAAEVEMQYESTTGGAIKSATARFDCVPAFSLGAAAPTIGQFVVTPSQGTLVPSTPLMVKYSAALPAGAVHTSVRVTGPCVVDRNFDERGETTVSRTLNIPLPYPCRLGVPIGVNVVVVDVLGRGVQLYEGTPVTMADTVPPRAFLTVLRLIPGRITVPAYGEYSLRDTLIASMGMSDNYRVSAVLWEILPVGVKDSIVSKEPPANEDGTSDGAQLWIGIRPEWAGKSLQLRVQARDAMGRLSDVITTPKDSIRVAAAP
jgi:hypothetical protein